MQNDSFKCVSIMRRIIGVKGPIEELTGIYFITLVVGYFACAQYDDIFFTLSVIILLIVKNIFTKFYKIIYKNDKIY